MKDNKDKLENEYKDNKKREIEFRIQYRDKTWYYGMPITKIKNGTVGFNSFDNGYYDLFADATTLGQFTGLCDKNGKKIYEGDIVKSHYGSIYIVKYLADWSSFSLKLVFLNTEGKLSRATGRQHLYKNDCTRLEIVGNVWDNPELFGGSDEECDN